MLRFAAFILLTGLVHVAALIANHRLIQKGERTSLISVAIYRYS
jgi:hypothetical protein